MKLALLCVTTCKRPRMLGAALASLERAGVAAGWEAKILVLDNDAGQSARPVFEGRAGDSAWRMRYAVERRRGLCAVRNRAIAEAIAEDADALVFFDDDQLAHPHCLRWLLEDMQACGADIINGRVQRLWPGGAPPWWASAGRKPAARPQRKRFCASGLTAYSRAVIARLRFDERFNFTGSEDIEYSHRANRAGFAVFQTDRPRADDHMAAAQATFGNHCRTLWLQAAMYARIHMDGGRREALRLAPMGLAKILSGLLRLALIPLSPRRQAAKSVHNIITGIGIICGICATRGYEKYRTIEGD